MNGLRSARPVAAARSDTVSLRHHEQQSSRRRPNQPSSSKQRRRENAASRQKKKKRRRPHSHGSGTAPSDTGSHEDAPAPIPARVRMRVSHASRWQTARRQYRNARAPCLDHEQHSRDRRQTSGIIVNPLVRCRSGGALLRRQSDRTPRPPSENQSSRQRQRASAFLCRRFGYCQSGRRSPNWILNASNLLAMRLRARLAALSACETSRPGTALPDEVVFLPTGLLQAGVASVVASLWVVPISIRRCS
jgi:hypothetical protein